MLVPENNKKGQPILHADRLTSGVWEGKWVTFFDNCIIDADLPSYIKANQSWDAIAACAAFVKKAKYNLAAEELCSSFIPIICSTDSMLHRKYATYQKQLAYCLATKLQKTHSVIMAWIHIWTQFAIF